MSHFIRTAVISLLLVYFFESCYYRNEDDLYPCNSMNITYTKTIKPIVDSRCTGCHNGSGTTLPGLYDFRDYNVLKRVALNGDSVYKAITGQFPGKPRMPFGGPYLSDCETAQIRTWVNLGAPF